MTTTLDQDTSIDTRLFRRLCDMVYRHCGINLGDGKQELVRARVARQLRGRNSLSATDYLEGVMADPNGEEFAGLIDALSTNLTSFFREPAHFEFLTGTLIPDLLQRKRRRRNNRIRAWSAACSTGEEPYSIAMTVLGALPAAERWDFKLLATDISRNVLRKAVNGVYDAARVAAVPAPVRAAYFLPYHRGREGAAGAAGSDVGPGGPGGGHQVRIDPRVRERVVFNYLNLIEPWPFSGPFDFIFCRNVMIYFDKPTQERLVQRFWQCMESGGTLFTGHSESLTGITHGFRYAQPTIYVKP